MAFPTIPTGARVVTGVQTGTSTTRTFPSLTGLTKNAGDLLIAICVAYQTGTGTDAAFSAWGASFTEFHDTATSATLAMGAAYKWSDGTETGTFTVTQAGAITGEAVFILLSIPGAHATTPPAAGGRNSSATTVMADSTSLDPANWAAEDTLWIAVGGDGETSLTGTYTGISAGPASYTNLALTAISSDSIGGAHAGVAFRQLNASSEDAGAWTADTSNSRHGAFLIAVRPAPDPAITQAAYRFYNDGTETGSTASAAQDTACACDLTAGDNNVQLRIRLQETAGGTPASTDDWQLQYDKNASGSWTTITTGTAAVAGFDSANLTDAAATTNRLTGGTGSFVAAKLSEDGLIDDVGWTASNFTELLYSLKIKAADLVNADVLTFRVLRNGATTTMTYTVTPQINVTIILPIPHVAIVDNRAARVRAFRF